MMSAFDAELLRLSRITPSSAWNETDVREEILAPILRCLGYARGTDYDINREQHLLLHPFLMIGSQKVRLDYAALIRRQHFWILEAKRPSSTIDQEAVHQAYFYAIHPEVQARFFAVSNGVDFVLYDVRELDEHYRPLLTFPLSNLPLHFARLRDLIGSDRVRDEVARRALADLDKVLGTEIRVERLNQMDARLKALVARAHHAVKENRHRLLQERFEAEDADIRAMHTHNDPVQVAQVTFEFLDTQHRFDLVFQTFKQKLTDLAPAPRTFSLRRVVNLLTLDLSIVHRANLILALVRLLPDLEPELMTLVERTVRQEIADIVHDFPSNERRRLFSHLEGLAKRVPYKLSLVDEETNAQLLAIVAQKLATLPERELAQNPPSLWTERHTRSSLSASNLLQQFSGAPIDALRSVVRELAQLEDAAEARYVEATRVTVDGESSPSHLSYWGKPVDTCRGVLFATLLHNFDAFSRLVSDEVVARAGELLLQVQDGVYHVDHADQFWVRMMHVRGRMQRPVDPVTGEPLSDEGFQLFMTRPLIARSGYSAIRSGMTITGRIDDDRWARYPLTLSVPTQWVEVGSGTLTR